MPKMDGLTVLSKLKANPDTAATPVIVLSASLHDQQKAIDRGASFFLQKPFKSDAILTALGSAMKKTEPQISQHTTSLNNSTVGDAK